MLILSVLLAILPLVGMVLLFTVSPLTTVDGLFTSLILLTISGIFGLNVLMELGKRGFPIPFFKAKPGEGSSAKSSAGGRTLARGASMFSATDGVRTEKALIATVDFYESQVGRHAKSIVTLVEDGQKGSKMVVFLGDLRNALLSGRKAVITYRSEAEGCALLNTQYF
jgi:hypothetical protein